MIDLSQYLFTTRTVKGLFQPREVHNGCKLKEEAKQFIGREFEFEVLWINDEGIYENEYALRDVSGEIRNSGVLWTASGDVVFNQ